MVDKLNPILLKCQHEPKQTRNNQQGSFLWITTYIAIALFFSLGYQDLVKAQISSDATVDTQVDSSENTFNITGGTTQNTNLFHSFQEFSVPTGGEAYFNNAAGIENIISRVTGSSISNIDGLLQANGNANLILINPNGIDFGANARLQIGGSFLGSTAKSLVFEDGIIFSADDLNRSPLLTVSSPVGLQLGQNPGSINVRGSGHNLSLEIPIFSPYSRGEILGLTTNSGNTFGLVGGDISFIGGVVASEEGRVELGAAAEGTVALNWSESGFSLNYDAIATFKNIDLNQRSLVDTSGNNSGLINIQGGNIAIADGSAVLIQNFGGGTSGNLEMAASGSLSLRGISEDGVVASGIYTEALGAGKGGDINVTASNVEILAGASIFTDSFGSASSGNINLNIADSLQINGFAEINPGQFSVISAQAYSTGNAGTVDISTNNLTATSGGTVASVTANNSTGSGGDLTVNATESISLSGINPIAFAPSQITAGSGSQGNAGNVELNTKKLTVIDGGRVDASATATGNAGNVEINASESIMVTGTVPDSFNPSLIIASANILDPELRQQFNLPDVPTGNSGNVTVETPQLQIMNGGQVTVRNDGTGNAGNLKIIADNINLENAGGITAAVEPGQGGTIDLDVTDSINLTSQSQISSDNHGAGNGGEIDIRANTLNISEGSFVTTTTFGSGKGGNVILNIDEAINITGIGFSQFQQTFQANSLNGNLIPGTRGTGIFVGTAADGIGGNLEISTNALNLAEGGIIFSPIFSNGMGGDIEIKNAQEINIRGSAVQIAAGIESSGDAIAGNIFIETAKLSISDGGTIVNATFGEATGGNINIDVSEMAYLQNTPDNSRLFTGIYANTSIGNGKGGNVNLQANNLVIDDAFISSTTGGFINDDANLAFSGGGDGGNISITVQDTIKILGIPRDPRFASGINSSSFTNGAAGNIAISTDKLIIRDGSEIAATTIGSGNGGNINISAIDSIELFGTTTVNNMQRGGLIATSGRTAFPELNANGDSGDIQIDTGAMNIKEGASIDVQSLGTGSAGNLNILSREDIVLDNQGTISAANNFGNGGNISISGRNIFWRGNSTTTATAMGNANGGNIEIIGDNLVMLESSELIAEAEIGMGGSINIDAKGLFICPECVVSSSSQLGIDGIVEINTLEPEPDLGIVELPIDLTQPEEAVAQACSNVPTSNNSRLSIKGRGGLPSGPNETLSGKSIVSFDLPQQNIPRNIPAIEKENNKQTSLPRPARHWYQNSKGEIVLSAQSSNNIPPFNSPNCHVR